jgi:hypothetical protein
MTRKIRIVLLVGVVVLAATGIYFAVSAHRSAPTVQERFDIMATIKPDTEFRVYRRLPKNNYWDDGNPFDRTTALTVLNALATATPWDHYSHAACYSPWDTQSPGLTIELVWCKDLKDKAQRDKGSVTLCGGNWLFVYGDAINQLTPENHEILNRVFPENK